MTSTHNHQPEDARFDEIVASLQQPSKPRRDPATIAGKVIGYTLVAALAVAVGLVIYGGLRHLAGWALG
ncbi:hypothetical protein [Cellulosimicrobium composti]|uniref:hypothetical protein n=1 Tax=Cellulosimicrobium composti TaxID=2672572 RepID=UPI0037A923D3